jgi:hypothetical protein
MMGLSGYAHSHSWCLFIIFPINWPFTFEPCLNKSIFGIYLLSMFQTFIGLPRWWCNDLGCFVSLWMLAPQKASYPLGIKHGLPEIPS